jgi:catalase
LIEVGVLELNRWPENYFAEVEQAGFSPANVVPGISWSPDRMLQARLFSYGDTQRYRLASTSTNPGHWPAPACPFHSYHRDRKMRVDGNLGRTLHFNPNSDELWDISPSSPSRHCRSKVRRRTTTNTMTGNGPLIAGVSNARSIVADL